MYFEGFINGYFVHTEKWYDGTIYFNVRYFRPGQSINQLPIFDKSVYITDNDKGRYMVQNFKSSLAEYVARMDIKPEHKVVITV